MLSFFFCGFISPYKKLQKLDFPAFDWPIASYPRLKYPLDHFSRENEQEEARCLEEAENTVKQWNSDPTRPDIAAMIVEPVQSEGGDNHASPSFFRELQKICKRHQLFFVVDEVQTGVGTTGAFWAHEHWGLECPPDAVTFSKKLQAAGFFHSSEFTPQQGARNFNTWMGDATRLVLCREIIDEIQRNHLLENVRVTGKYLKEGLEALERTYHPFIHSVRGMGTFLAFDLNSQREQAMLVEAMNKRGVELMGCGERSIRLRPMLNFLPKHAKMFLEILEDALISLRKHY